MPINVTSKPINLNQLGDELTTAGVAYKGLGTSGPSLDDPTVVLYTFDADGAVADLPAAAQQVVDAHVAMRPKTSEEYAAEFQNPATTAARKQEIRDIQNGLLPPEMVPMT